MLMHLKTCVIPIVTCKEHSAISLQTQRATTSIAQRHVYVPAELLLRCRKPYCVAMVSLLRSHPTLIRTLSHSFFKHTVIWRSMQSHSVYWQCQCVAVEMVAVVLHALPHSVYIYERCLIAMRRLLWCDGGFRQIKC